MPNKLSQFWQELKRRKVLYFLIGYLAACLEKPEALTILRRDEIFKVNFKLSGHLPGHSGLARSGQAVRFFHFCYNDINVIGGEPALIVT